MSRPRPVAATAPCPRAIHVGGRGLPLSLMPASVKPPIAASPNTIAAASIFVPLQFLIGACRYCRSFISSAKHLADGLAAGQQRDGSAREIGWGQVGRNAQEAVHRRQQIGRAERAIQRQGPLGIAGTDDLTV